MNTYRITFRDHSDTECAATPGKAKYLFFLNHDLGESMEFGDFVKGVEGCKLLHKFTPRDLFGNVEQFDWMKQQRGIPFAYMGMRVEVNGNPGVIVGANQSSNLDVCLDGESWRSNCHPFYRVKYFDRSGNIVAEYGD